MTDFFLSFFLQSIVCAGMMIWNFVKEKNFVGQILVFVLLYSSLYSTYLWTGKWDHEEKFKSPSSPSMAPASCDLFEVQQFRLRIFAWAVTPTNTESLQSCVLFPDHSVSTLAQVVSSHIAFSLGPWDLGHSQHSFPLEIPRGQALKAGRARKEWAEEKRHVRCVPELTIRIQLN